MPEVSPALTFRSPQVGPNHKKPLGIRDHKCRPVETYDTRTADPMYSSMKADLQKNPDKDGKPMGYSIIAVAIGVFALYAIFYRG